jgi:plastocyanin
MKLTKFLVYAALVGLMAACSSGPATPTSAPQGTPPGYPAPGPTSPSTTGGYPPQSTPAVSLPPGYPAAPTAAPTQPVPTAAPGGPTAPTAFVTYQDFEILPSQSTIAAGANVIFVIKSASGAFHQPYVANVFEAPGQLGEGQVFAWKFDQAGTYTLLCGYHTNMQATMTVTP